MITVPGLTVTTVVDQIYDTSAGTDVVVSATGTTTPLLTGALIPIGITNNGCSLLDPQGGYMRWNPEMDDSSVATNG